MRRLRQVLRCREGDRGFIGLPLSEQKMREIREVSDPSFELLTAEHDRYVTNKLKRKVSLGAYFSTGAAHGNGKQILMATSND
jgi:hypothetical protein